VTFFLYVSRFCPDWEDRAVEAMAAAAAATRKRGL